MGPIHSEPLLDDLDADPVDSAAAGNGVLLGIAAAIALVVAGLDLLTHRVHLPIAYIVPLILIEQLDRRGSGRLCWFCSASSGHTWAAGLPEEARSVCWMIGL